MCFMEVFISLKGTDRPFADSFISDNLKTKYKFKFWYLFDLKKEKTGDNTKEVILNKIDSSSGALLLVSKEFLKSEFINNYELPAIFRKKEEDSAFKVFPVFIENCDVSENKYLKNLEFYNSPGTNFQTLKNRSAKEYSEKVNEINKFIDKNISRGGFLLSQLKRSRLIIASLLLTVLFLLVNNTFYKNRDIDNSISNDFVINENSTTSTILENYSFNNLNEGDCFNYDKSFIAFALTQDILDKNATTESSGFLSLILENGYIGEELEIVQCDKPHYFEVIYASNSKVLNDEGIEIESQPDIIEFCIEKSFEYSGYKFRNINGFIGAKYRKTSKNFKFICASYAVDEDLKVVQKNYSHKDIKQLSDETLYETSFDKLNIGDCFLHVNSWAIKKYETTYQFGGYLDELEVVSCSDYHTNELIYEVKLESSENGIKFPGVKLPLKLEEIDSYNYPRIVNIPNQRFNYPGGYIYEVYTNNKYAAPINNIKNLIDVQYDLQNEEDVYIALAPYDNTSIHVIKIDGSPNIVTKSRIAVLTEAEKLCDALPITGTDLYTDFNTSLTYWEVFPMFSEDPQSSTKDIILRCVLRLRSNDPLTIAGLTLKNNDNSASQKLKGSFSESFTNKFGDSLLNKREIRIKYNLENADIEVKKLTDLKTGDCFKADGLFDYENYLSDTWNEDWLIKVSDCNVAHDLEVIISRPTLLSNDNRKELYEGCKDYVFVNLQFSKKLTLGNFEYSNIDYENSSFYFSSENLSLKDLYYNKFFNKNLVDSKGVKKGSICIHYYGEKNNNFLSKPPNDTYYSAFEIFEPTSLNIENFYCPDEIKKDTYTEVVFRYTRGPSEIASLEYIEINGNLSVKVDGLDDEYYGYDKGYIKTTINKTFEGLAPSGIELVENTGEGVLTATITDELGNSDSAICTYKITN